MEEKKTKKKQLMGSLRSIFRHADWVDKLLMLVGFLGAVCDGLSIQVSVFTMGRPVNIIGTSESLPSDQQQHNSMNNIIKNSLVFCYIAFGQWIACFLEGYCWARTAERQVSSMRTAYLKAVLRQEIAYFDLRVTDTAEVVANISNDSLVILDFISEKVPRFVSNLSTSIGAYVAAFFMLWRLAIVGFPFIVFLVIPGVVYGRILMSISRKLREEYNKADTIVEQAISSTRTVYSFMTSKLGWRQGSVKGLAVGSNAIVFAVWAFMSYYGSRLVMYHGAKGGTVFAVTTVLVFGGFCISNLDSYSEAGAAAERIMEIIERVPKIDSDSIYNLPGTIALLQRFYDPIRVYFLHDHEEIKKMTKIYCITLVALILFAILVNICRHYNFASMGERLTNRIREIMLSKILTFEIGWYDRDENATGTICSRLGKDANTVRSLVIDRMALLIGTFSTVTIACLIGFFISWRLAWVMIVVQPLVIISFYLRHGLLKTLSKKAIKFQEESSKIAAEAVTNIRTVSSFNAQALILQILEKAQESPRKESIRQAWFAGVALGTSATLLKLCWALDYWYGW
ncbi:OLC1v1002832C1 [Oldenlandia corymbosa var. corymbosa]|uniref:OLC1v1002832C1 n=1 Tax=Oldenlandia corymbosa var. corymbosa TaxID=529605 RepID=A0AAV1DBH7_OLDCO|nr:OLC1v1002832C1 [Oldenlandia corymbosa var. corymbosa]